MRQMFIWVWMILSPCECVNSEHQLAVLLKLSISAGVRTVYRYRLSEESAARRTM